MRKNRGSAARCAERLTPFRTSGTTLRHLGWAGCRKAAGFPHIRRHSRRELANSDFFTPFQPWVRKPAPRPSTGGHPSPARTGEGWEGWRGTFNPRLAPWAKSCRSFGAEFFSQASTRNTVGVPHLEKTVLRSRFIFDIRMPPNPKSQPKGRLIQPRPTDREISQPQHKGTKTPRTQQYISPRQETRQLLARYSLCLGVLVLNDLLALLHTSGLISGTLRRENRRCRSCGCPSLRRRPRDFPSRGRSKILIPTHHRPSRSSDPSR